MRQHKHKPRIIGMNTMTYRKGTVVCSVCGLKLKDPTGQELLTRTSVTERHKN